MFHGYPVLALSAGKSPPPSATILHTMARYGPLHAARYATELLLVHQSVHHRAARILSSNIPQTISSPRLFLHFPMQADGLAFISAPDFAKACRSLVHQSRETDLLRMTLRLCPETGTQYLASVRTQIPSQVIPLLSDYETEESEGWAEEDELDAAAVHHAKTTNPSVEYNVILSPSYQVPVLYVILHNFPSSGEGDIEALHKLLVPEHMKPNLKQVGVIGGISMTNHPFTHIPAYFIHPCKTAEAMQNIIGHSNVSPEEYLQIWFGLIGSCVGLYLPSQLVVPKPQGN